MPLLCVEGKSEAWHLSVKHDNVTKQQFKHTSIVISCRQRLSPVREDLENLIAEEPVGELGLDLPELNPKSARSAVADEDMDTDVDVVAQQR